jgi:type II secretory pathway pseudopilin PulG
MKFFSKQSDVFFVPSPESRTVGYGAGAPRRAIRGYAKEKAFSLVETAAAVAILAFVCSGLLVVINRYMDSAVDSVMRMRAFEVARTNMEELLTLDVAEESVEFGDSERYPDIQWETAVESFYEPITEKMWIQAICSAEYTDSEGEVRKVELTHWLTDLTKEQTQQILARQEEEKERLDEETEGMLDELDGVDPNEILESMLPDDLL